MQPDCHSNYFQSPHPLIHPLTALASQKSKSLEPMSDSINPGLPFSNEGILTVTPIWTPKGCYPCFSPTPLIHLSPPPHD